MSGSWKLGVLIINYTVLDLVVTQSSSSSPWASPKVRLAHLYLWIPILDPKPGQWADLSRCSLSEWFGKWKAFPCSCLKATYITVVAHRFEVVNLRTPGKYILAVGMYFFPHYGCQMMPIFSSLLFTAAVIYLLSKWHWPCIEDGILEGILVEVKARCPHILEILSPGNSSVLGFPSEQLVSLEGQGEADWQILWLQGREIFRIPSKVWFDGSGMAPIGYIEFST